MDCFHVYFMRKRNHVEFFSIAAEAGLVCWYSGFAAAVLFAAFRIPVLRVRVRPPTMVETTAFVRLWLSMPLWEVLEEWLPAPSCVLLLAVSSFGACLDSIVAAKLRQQRRYTYLVESVLLLSLAASIAPVWSVWPLGS